MSTSIELVFENKTHRKIFRELVSQDPESNLKLVDRGSALDSPKLGAAEFLDSTLFVAGANIASILLGAYAALRARSGNSTRVRVRKSAGKQEYDLTGLSSADAVRVIASITEEDLDQESSEESVGP